MVRLFAILVGLAALLSTVALVSIDIVVAVQAVTSSQARTASSVAAFLEALVWATMASCLATLFCKSTPAILSNLSSRKRNSGFYIGLLLIVMGGAASIANVVRLDKIPTTSKGTPFHGSKRTFVITSAVIMVVTIIFQLAFLFSFFILSKPGSAEENDSVHTDDSNRPNSKWRVKAVPYSQTRANNTEKSAFERTEFSTISRPASAARVSASPRSSLSHTIRSVSSKTRLLPTSLSRTPSLESSSSRRWETDSYLDASEAGSSRSSSLKRDNSMTIYTKPPRMLATIPASPTVKETPEFSTPLDLELPPPIQGRGRSNSASSITSVESAEGHIHPLFRSDSPTPPPRASPGTSVMAAPNAGLVLPRRASNQSLRRIRSSSMTSNSSPLSQFNSFENLSTKRQVDERVSIREVDEEHESVAMADIASPIPKFVLNAGNRSSLTEYHCRKLNQDSTESLP